MSLRIHVDSGACPHCGHDEEFFETDITRNLSPALKALGLGDWLWCSDGSVEVEAGDLVAPLESAVAQLVEDPARFEQMRLPTDRGTYPQLLPRLQGLLKACKDHPSATVSAYE